MWHARDLENFHQILRGNFSHSKSTAPGKASHSPMEDIHLRISCHHELVLKDLKIKGHKVWCVEGVCLGGVGG